MTLPPGSVSDPSRVTATDLVFPSGTARIDGYLARPVAGGNGAGVIIVHDVFGVSEHTRDVARRFANLGYNALAPNLYARTGTPDGRDMAGLFAAMFAVPDGQVVADLEAAAAYLRALDSANGKVGVIGFCVGGRWTLLYTVSSHTVDASVPCWPGFIDRATPDAEVTRERPTPVIDLAGGLRCPLFVAGGAEDENPSPAVLEELGRRLESRGSEVTIRIFDGAGHAFFADHRPEFYRAEQARQFWRDAVGFFGRHLL